MIFQCDRCATKHVGIPGHPPAGWVWTDRLRVCGECHRKVIRKP